MPKIHNNNNSNNNNNKINKNKNSNVNEITEDAHELIFFRSYAGSEQFTNLLQAATFKEAVAFLDEQFRKPSGVVFARCEVLSAQQGDDISAECEKKPRFLMERCKCAVLTIQEQKN